MFFRAQKMVLQTKNCDTYALHFIGVHCMAHWFNLVIQTLLGLPLVVRIENFVQCLYSSFAHSPKRHWSPLRLWNSWQQRGTKFSGM